MKTRKKSNSINNNLYNNKYTVKNNQQNIVNTYNDLYAEFFAKQSRLKTEFKQCQKWKKLNPSQFRSLYINSNIFQPIAINQQNNISKIFNNINILKKYIQITQQDYINVHAISQIEYRKLFGLTHTLTKKKINIYKSVFKNIDTMITASKKNYAILHKKYPPHIHKKVTFSNVVKVKILP